MIRTAALLTLVLGTPASAQLLQDPPTVVIPNEPPLTTARSAFERASDIPVTERMFPAFSAQGVRVGNFDLFPAVQVSPLLSSNVFADNDRKRSDVALVVRPEATIRTSGGPYRLTAFARSDLRRFATQTSENSEEWQLGTNGRVALGAFSNVTAGATYGSLIVPRFAPDSSTCAGKPIEYRDLSGFAGGTIEGASTRVILRADATRLRFDDAPDRCNGGTLLARDRDRTRVAGLVRIERALSPALSLYAAGTANRFDYRLPTAAGLNRDSSGFGLYAGVNAEVSRLLRADVRAGYIRQTFKTAGVERISGFGAQGQVLYFPTRLTTVTLTGESSIQDTGVPGTTGVLRRGGAVRVDHEFRRYIMGAIDAGYFRETYRGDVRRDRLPTAGASLTYLSGNRWNAQLAYRYRARDITTGGTPNVSDFDDHRLQVGLTLQY